MTMAVLLDHELLINRKNLEKTDDFIDMIIHFENTFQPLLMRDKQE